jgi:hypothetical protein
MLIYTLLMLFHLPLAEVNRNTIGLFDIYILVLLFAVIALNYRLRVPRYYRFWLLTFLIYIIYLFISIHFFMSQKGFLVALKYIEYLGIAVLLMWFLPRYSKSSLLVILNLAFILASLYSILNYLDYYHNILPIRPNFGLGSWHRAGLPFTYGTASNPAGVVYGAFILFNLRLRHIAAGRKELLLHLGALVMALGALFCTVSRTNILALLMVLGVMVVVEFVLHREHRLKILIAVGLAGGLLVGMMNVIPEKSEIWRFFKLIEDPTEIYSRIMQESSFQKRLNSWGRHLDLWTDNLKTVLVGKGARYFSITDSSYFGLLVNQGMIGLLLFSLPWFVYTLIVSRPAVVKYLGLFLLISAINAETLLTSYRAIPAVITLLFAAHYLEQPAAEEQEGAPAHA